MPSVITLRRVPLYANGKFNLACIVPCSVHVQGLQYSFVCECVCVTYEATLIYSAKNGHQLVF